MPILSILLAKFTFSHFAGNHLSSAVETNKEEVEMSLTANQVFRIIEGFLIVTREKEREKEMKTLDPLRSKKNIHKNEDGACIFSRLQ